MMMYEKEFQAFTFTAHQAVNIQLAEKVCFFKKVLVLNPYPQTPFPRKGAECGAAVDYNIKCNTKKYGHHTHFRVKCNYHKTKDTEVEYEVLYTFYTI